MKRTIAAASLLIIGFALFASLPVFAASLPQGTAVFETSLQSRISSTDTSLTLVANSVRGGSSLSGYNCFTLDEGRSDAEYVCGTVSGTSVTSLTRGIDPGTGTSTNSALKFAHRVGADIKITDFPLVQILRNQANGADTYEHTLRYASGVTPSTPDDLTDKGYVDGLAFSGAGIIDATSVAKGVVELATGCEAASSTSAGSSGTLSIPASLASSTRTSPTLSACKVVVANNSGVIDDNYIATSTLFATSSITGGPIGAVGKNIQVFTSTGTSTFSVPSGVKRVCTEVQAGGGGGSAGGGGGGGYTQECVDVSATTSIQVYVGPGGALGPNGSAGTKGSWSTFGTNGFYNSATGGDGGSASNNTFTNGGAGSGGDLNLTGGTGLTNFTGASATTIGGLGGASRLGMGGQGGAGNNPGIAGINYGGGGGGSGGNGGGGAGAQGIVIVRW